MDPTAVDLDQLLRERFGFPAFRPGQRASIDALLAGGNLLSIQPTGYGKSLLYQLPAALLPGMTIVVSPLLALVRDQLGHLNNRFDLPAASINSDQSEEENDAARQAAADGRVRLLFVSPEHLDHVERFAAIARLPVDLLVVDEAHCISTWGHDFRPAYRQIVHLLHALRAARPALRVLALTATADARVEDDIRRQLEGERAPPLTVHRSSMDRPNLALAVVPAPGMAHKLAYLAQLVPRLPRPGLLYCATRERTELVAEYLQLHGVDAAAYHAGLEPEHKRELQDDFLRGRYTAIAATNALGMGIDKSDLRYVLHVDLPGSITAYYQEVGRAGRDGQPARGILLFDPDDRRIQDHFIDAAQPEPRDFTAILDAIAADPDDPPGLTALKVRSGLHPTRVTVVVAELVEQGFITKHSRGGKQIYLATPQSGVPDLERYRRQSEVRGRELDAMLRYGQLETNHCLMATLRSALGDDAAAACGRCSRCRNQSSSVQLGDQISAAAAWLERRPSPIPASARPPMAAGLSLLDGELGGPLFGWLMKHREHDQPLPAALADLIRERAHELAAHHAFVAVIPVPSQRWAQRDQVATLIADALGVPALTDTLTWRDPPTDTQDALANNDQRRHNVDNKLALTRPLPAGDLLVLDDIIGSGATLREAGRALGKQARRGGALVPLTLARVRRRLGAPR